MIGGGGKVGSAWYELELRDEGFLGQLQAVGRGGQQALGPAGDAAAEVGDKLAQAGEQATKSGGLLSRFGDVGKGAIMGVGLAVGNMVTQFALQLPLQMIGQLGNAIQLSSDKAESASKVNVLFGDSAEIVQKKSESAASSVALSSGKYLALAGTLGNLVINFGITGDAAANMSTDMIQLAADMGSFHNADTSEVVEAMGAAFRGETEPIRRFGVMLSADAIAAQAVAMGLAESTKNVSSSAKAQATYQLILQQTTAAQGDLARTSDGLANAQRLAAARQEEAWTRLGDKIKPLATAIIPMMIDAMAGLVDLIVGVVDSIENWIRENQGLIDALTGLAKGAIGLVIEQAKNLVTAAKTVIDLALGPLKPVVIGVALVFTANLIPALVETAVQMGRNVVGAAVSLATTLSKSLIPGLGGAGQAAGQLTLGLEEGAGAAKGLGGGILGMLNPISLAIAGVAALVVSVIDFVNAEARGKQAARDMIAALEDQAVADGKLLTAQQLASQAADDLSKKWQQQDSDLFEIIQRSAPFIGGLHTATVMQERQAAMTELQAAAQDEYNAAIAASRLEEYNKLQEEGRQKNEEIAQAIRDLGPEFTRTAEAEIAMAKRFGVDTVFVTNQWNYVEQEFADASGRIREHLATLPAGMQLTAQKTQEIADLLGVTADQVTTEWAAMAGGAKLSAEQMKTTTDGVKAAVLSLGPGFTQSEFEVQALADRFGLTAEQVKAAWAEASAGMAAETTRITDYLETLPEGFTMTSDAASMMADLLGVSADRVVEIWQGMATDVVATTGQLKDKALAIAYDIGTAIPTGIGRGALDEQGELTDAMSNLREILKNGLTPDQQAAKVLGKKWIQLFTNGIDSEKDGAKEATFRLGVEGLQALSAATIGTNEAKRISQIAAGLYQDGWTDSQILVALASQGVGKDALLKLAQVQGWSAAAVQQALDYVAGMNSQDPAAARAGSNLEDAAHDATTSLNWRAAGSGVAYEWVAGFGQAIRDSEGHLRHVLRDSTDGYRGASPPKSGPLHFIDRDAAKIGHAWVGGFAGAIRSGRVTIDAELDRLGRAAQLTQLDPWAAGGLTFSSASGATLRIVHELDLRNAPDGITNGDVASILGPTMNAELYLRNLGQSALLPPRMNV